MGLVIAVFFALLLLAAAFGRVADSRDYADWRPTRDGERCSPRR